MSLSNHMLPYIFIKKIASYISIETSFRGERKITANLV